MKKYIRMHGIADFQKYLKAFLLFFDDFCQKNDIKYSLFAGTLLGAVRNGDIIPWDGDIDVCLTYKELTKLKEAFNHYHGRYYLSYLPNHLLKKRTSKELWTCHVKLLDKKCPNHLFLIDVLTFDFLGNDLDKANELVDRIKAFRDHEKYSIGFHLPEISLKYRSFKSNCLAFLIHILHPILYPVSWILTKRFIKRYDLFCKEYYSFDENSKYAVVEPAWGRYPVKDNVLLKDGYTRLKFGNHYFMCMKNYDYFLKTVYGDYMKLPPKEKQIPYPPSLADCKFKIEIDDELEYYLSKL